jgi:uncharacterized protein YqeY
MVNEVDRWKARLRERIRAAMKAREASVLSMWREVLALVENAEAVPVASSATGVSDDAPFAASIAGLGSAEATRRVLSSDEVRTLLVADVAERRSAAGEFDRVGQGAAADVLRAQAAALEDFLAENRSHGAD